MFAHDGALTAAEPSSSLSHPTEVQVPVPEQVLNACVGALPEDCCGCKAVSECVVQQAYPYTATAPVAQYFAAGLCAAAYS